MMAADYRHIGGRENRLGRHYSRFPPFWPTPALSGQSLALRKLCDAGSNRRSQVRVDTRQRDATASAAIREALTPFFEDGAFQAPVIDRVIPLSEGCSSYAQVARGEARGRLVLMP